MYPNCCADVHGLLLGRDTITQSSSKSLVTGAEQAFALQSECWKVTCDIASCWATKSGGAMSSYVSMKQLHVQF